MNSIDKLKAIKSFSGMTQQKIASELDVTFAALNRWMTGKAIPRKSTEEKINKLYKKYFNGEEKTSEDYLVYKSIISENLDFLSSQIFSEDVLRKIAKRISSDGSCQEIIYKLVVNIPRSNRNYDWNVGSILQHFESSIVLDMFRRIENTSPFHNSIGLAWVLGELNTKDSKVIDYLYSIVNYSTDSDAWWRAAFSIEKLGVEEAVNLLKRSQKTSQLRDLNFYLSNISDRRSIISILVLSNVENVEKIIYPKLKEIFISSKDAPTLISCCWLIGRFNLIDDEILPKLIKLIDHKNYELKYYTFFALQHNTTEALRPFLENALFDKDALIRKMACRSIRSLGNENSLGIVQKALLLEDEQSVISELSETIYSLKNPINKNKFILEQKSYKNENGLISDETDKWYKDSAIYNLFSEAEDPENVCFDLIKEQIKNKKIVNPIDLATGTGRMVWQIINKLNYKGTLVGSDISVNMCDFLEKSIKRGRGYSKDIKILQSSIIDLPTKIKEKSNFIISSFGFPSRISNKKLCMQELKAVYSMLSDDGILVTLGWDETFNDELNMVWFKYIPDNIQARDFEEWRRKRSSSIESPRGCGLSWMKRGIHVPLQFSSLRESAMVMGYLFGRDAAQSVIKDNKTEWMMSLGITLNDKKSIKNIIDDYEKRNRNTI